MHFFRWFFLIGAAPLIAQTLPSPESFYYQDLSERVHEYTFRTFTDPVRLGWLLVDSAEQHMWREPRQWDRSSESYGMRVASGWGRRIVRNSVQFGIETALHEDSRYRRSQELGFRRRAWFAVKHSALAYKPDGSTELMYGRIIAGVSASAVSSTWHPGMNIAPSRLAAEAVSSIAERAGNNLLAEFQPELTQFGKQKWKSFRAKKSDTVIP